MVFPSIIMEKLPVSAKTYDILANFSRILPIKQKNPALPKLAEPDHFSYFFRVLFVFSNVAPFYRSIKSSIEHPSTFEMRYKTSAFALLMFLFLCSYIWMDLRLTPDFFASSACVHPYIVQIRFKFVSGNNFLKRSSMITANFETSASCNV